ncbi:MAG: hypothetical protein PW788_08895 [Micavibrio sp.]|nr:hypothetical protein [Micavibrio sp.]
MSVSVGSGFFGRILCGLRPFLFSLCALLLTACVPSGDEAVNTDLFKDKTDLATRTASLRPGMSKKAVFETLGIRQDKFEHLGLQDVQVSMYGNSQVQGTPEQLEGFRRKLAACEGYSLPYRQLKSDSSLGFGKLKIEKTGYDLRLMLIFDHGKLVRSSIEGTQNIRQVHDQYLWEGLLRRGIGLAF